MCFAQLVCTAAVGTVLVGSAGVAGNRTISEGDSSAGMQSSLEDIYLARSILESRTTTPSASCEANKIGFSAQIEDRYTFKSVTTRAKDGKVVDATGRNAGTLQACFESIPGAADTNFYSEGKFGGVNFSGKGKCAIVAANFPETGTTSAHCFLVLSKVSPPYFAGVLTTNSLGSRKPLGERSEPAGYVQISIATIRLWRKRQ